MKLMMFAALAAAVATPALAQTMPAPAPADQTMSTPAPSSDQQASTAMANQSGATPSAMAMPAEGSYPMCSRTVTDHCMERSNARGERLHSTPRPRR